MAKQRILEIVTSAGSGLSASIPTTAVAVRLGWEACHHSLVEQLAREIMFDGDFPQHLGFADGCLFHAASACDRKVAAQILKDLTLQYQRIVLRLRGDRL